MDKKNNELMKLAVDAIEKAATILNSQYGRENIFGFALCTDDEVGSLYHVACTKDWVEEATKKQYPEIGYISVEWKQTAGSEIFDPVVKWLNNAGPDRFQKRDDNFESLVLAIEECKKRGLFTDDTLLCIGSTDPSGQMEMLAMRAVDRLNKKTVADNFAQALMYEAYRL